MPKACAECGEPFTRKRHDQVFCSKACRFDDHNRTILRSRELYRMAYHWRLGHGKGQRGSLIGELSSVVKRWVEEDKLAGRSPPPLPEALQRRVEGARMGYVRVTGRGYVKDAEAAAEALEELTR